MLKEYYSNEPLYKKDWKLFREKIPEWQEAYMERLNREYIALLSGDGNVYIPERKGHLHALLGPV